MHFTHTGCAEQPLVQYRACGLDNVYLRSGYDQRVLAGENFISVRDADELHALIAKHLAARTVLTLAEVRFLNKHVRSGQAHPDNPWCLEH